MGCHLISCQLQAVLHIVDSSPELTLKARPHIDEANEAIAWEAIWSNDFSSGYLAALFFAHAIWTENYSATHNPFERAWSMDERMRRAVAEAIDIWLGITSTLSWALLEAAALGLPLLLKRHGVIPELVPLDTDAGDYLSPEEFERELRSL